MNNVLTLVTMGALLSSSSIFGSAAAEKMDAPLFDGKTLDCLDSECAGAWKVEKGAIVNKQSDYGGGQSRQDYSDGILRFRFENSAADEIAFEFHQGAAGRFRVAFSKSECARMAGKTHELVVVCDGATVTAKLDGKVVTVTASTPPHEGRFKFNVDHGTLRVLEIGYQKLPAK